MRVVRFTDVDSERMRSLRERIDDSEGPPEGVPASGMQVLLDESQGTAVVIQHFASREDMEEGARVLDAMDPGETPGTRASVDACELLVDLHA
jgi:hypothetical protein